MKPFYFTLVLMLAAPLAAEELSKEEYLKEVNKAFSKIYEATKGKTLSAQLVALEALSVEYKDNKPVSDLLLQERGTAYSLMGRHQQALHAFDQHDPNPDELNTAVKNLVTRDAVTAILDASADYQVVMINEAHHVPQHRVLTYRLLKGLWENGYRYLAFEALAPDAEQELTNNYVHKKSGFYTEEPLFANLVLYATELGFKLISYDYGAEIGTGTEARERSAVKNLREKVFDNEPDAKMVIHVGYSHINEDGWLAHYLKEALQLDPLTVNQTDFTERSHKRHEPESYTWLIENHDFDTPVVLTNNDGAFWSPTPEEYDITVVWPRTEYRLNRPNWARLDKELIPVNLDWCELQFPCAIEVYRMGEEEEVPADRIIITESSTPIGIFISESSRLVKVTDSQGKVINTVTVPLKESD